MIANQTNTALLVFSLSAKKEKERKAIFGKKYKQDNEKIFDLLIQKTQNIAYRSGVDVIWMDEHQQQGDSFSEKISNAFQKLFKAGYQNVISIGNDCPDLSIDILKYSIEELKTKKMVLGPAKDGGVYLLGIHKSVFDKSKFFQLPWQKDSLLKGFIDYAKDRNLHLVLLKYLRDLDSFKDVFLYSKEKPSTDFSRLLKTILTSQKGTYFSSDDTISSTSCHTYNGLRAPPQV